MAHIVLLGDSVFDNQSYVGKAPDVTTQLRAAVPTGWRVSLLAADGGTVASVTRQIERLPDDASHLIVSAGGNDALERAHLLDAPSRSVAESLLLLAGAADIFKRDYQRMLDALSSVGRAFALCTIYDPRFEDAVQRKLSTTGLMLFNDAIIRESAAHGLPILDLRLICNDDGDFANPIEPSSRGGAKIAAAICALVRRHVFSRGISEVYAR